MVCVCERDREQLTELALCLNHVGSRDQTQILGFNSKHLYLPAKTLAKSCYLYLALADPIIRSLKQSFVKVFLSYFSCRATNDFVDTN